MFFPVTENDDTAWLKHDQASQRRDEGKVVSIGKQGRLRAIYRLTGTAMSETYVQPARRQKQVVQCIDATRKNWFRALPVLHHAAYMDSGINGAYAAVFVRQATGKRPRSCKRSTFCRW